jgi:hypothetical protein
MIALNAVESMCFPKAMTKATTWLDNLKLREQKVGWGAGNTMPRGNQIKGRITYPAEVDVILEVLN